ncbi:MAG TPA: Gfo/Idh/MocA family oxidoreductase [Actinomycetota bacterium]|nr:Gfo/Idh/MocA family oxidoreductase [Actinomycetota bacterium]
MGVVGAGSVLWAYLQQLDRLVPKGLAWEGPVCARRRDTWPSLRQRRPAIALVDTPEEVFASEVDVVAILTSPASHASLAIEAVRHGKHVVVEKPLGLSVDEARSVYDEAARARRHVVAAPFVLLSPTFRELWTRVADGAIGAVHAARASYGNLGAPWATWFREREIGPLAEVGIYNLASLTALLGAAVEVSAMANTSPAEPAGASLHVSLRHASGAISSITASHAMHAYRRPAIELFGTDGTANLLGDDWDPRGIELWRGGVWRSSDARDPTWLWTDGLRELAVALADGRPPRTDPAHVLHVLELIDAATTAARDGTTVAIGSRPEPPDLRIDLDADVHVHDHTRPPDEQ